VLEVVLKVLGFVLLEAVNGGCALCARELEGMHRVQLCMLEAVEGEFCLQEVVEVMRCVLLCIRRVDSVC